jgi:hypothetical protein
MRISNTVAAWMAALIDGEGTVMLVRHAWGAATLARYPSRANSVSYRPRVGIYNTDKRLMDAIVAKTGVDRVYAHRISSANGRDQRAKVAYEWRINATECRWLLPIVLPWLVCKVEQANLLLEALDLMATRRPIKGKVWHHLADRAGRAVSNARIIAIADRMNSLNRKGIRKEVAL